MELDNITAQGKLPDGFAFEVLFRHHNVALFSVILASLILGLPLAWNVLWHLQENFQIVNYLQIDKLPQITFFLSDSEQCKRERCPPATLNSASDKPSLYTYPLPAIYCTWTSVAYRCAATAMSTLRNSGHDSHNKPHSLQPCRGVGEVKS